MSRETDGRLIPAAAFLMIALTVLTACTPRGTTVSTGPQETTITGRLGGATRGDAGCAWLETSSGERIAVVYPNGWHIEFTRVALFDETGRQVAEDGETLVLDGYFNQVGASVCNPERSFVATRVTVGH